MKCAALPSLLLAVLTPAIVRSATILYTQDQKTNPAAVFEANGDCTAAKGCLEEKPIKLTFNFTLTDAELNLVKTKNGIGLYSKCLARYWNAKQGCKSAIHRFPAIRR